MANDPSLIVVRLEKRMIAMRPVMAAIAEALSSSEVRLDIAQIMPQNPDKFALIDRVRSVVHGVVATAGAQEKALLAVHVACSPITFINKDKPHQNVDVAIIAVAGHFTPLRFWIKTNPSSKVPEMLTIRLRQIAMQMQMEMPEFRTPEWQEGVAFGEVVAESLFHTLFKGAIFGEKTADDPLQ